MSVIKKWKQVSHVKNSQINDNQSVGSHSRSASSYQFKKVTFNKPKQQHRSSQKRCLGLSSVVKTKQQYRKQSYEKHGRTRSHENSFASLLERQQLELKNPGHRKIQGKLKHFLTAIRKVHCQLKLIAENMLTTFEQVKEEMEIHLIKVADELLKMGKQVQNIEKVKQIMHQGFRSIRRSIVILPMSMTELNNFTEVQVENKRKVREVPLTPLLKNERREEHRQQKANGPFSSTMIPRGPGQTVQQLPLSSVRKQRQKVRPETHRQRRRPEMIKAFSLKQPQQSPQQLLTQKTSLKSIQNTKNLSNIISQMRQILNQ